MLSDQLKDSIRKIHRNIADSLNNYQPRKSQNYLVAEIAKTLAGEFAKDRRIAVIEAGTGTGKSLAYSLGCIPYALKTNKKVVISTATVALQEQLLHKDLPFFHRVSGLDFEMALVKGRQRYVCLSKLASMAVEDQEQLGFEQLLTSPLPKGADKIINAMQEAIDRGKWDGDVDTWPEPVPSQIWSAIQSDRHSCKRSLAFHRNCPFHKARERLNEADVLIINHHLLVADLELGGGKILPDLDDCIFVIDEAHHLPDIVRSSSAVQVSIGGALEWLKKIPKLINQMESRIGRDATIQPVLKATDAQQELTASMSQFNQWATLNRDKLFAESKETTYRFVDGRLPTDVTRFMEEIEQSARPLLQNLEKLQELLQEGVSDGNVKAKDAEPLFIESGFFIQRVDNLYKLGSLLAKERSEKAPPLAVWLEKYRVAKSKREEMMMAASPLEIGFMLEDNLWSKCSGAVLCSATLTALNNFDYFRHKVGLDAHDGTHYLKVDSPFNYQQHAQLHIPNVKVEPSHPTFSAELISRLPALFAESQATLVLFSSYWQMEEVADGIRHAHPTYTLLIQGEMSRQKLLSTHKKRIDKGEKSIIFGTQGLSEGLDLPGDYLTHVIITKLPFAVPTSPIEEAHAEYISAKGGNPFLSLTVPEAGKKLVQAAGRLIRTESDTGKVTILDRRLVSKRYGKSMLDSLPPFKRQIDY